MNFPFHFQTVLFSDFNDIGLMVEQKIRDDQPFMLGRIGGSDTDAVIDYYKAINTSEDFSEHTDRYCPLVKKFNGFYSFNSSERQDYLDYVRILLEAYSSSRFMSVCNNKLLSLFFPDSPHSSKILHEVRNKKWFESFFDQNKYVTDKTTALFPYAFIEQGIVGSDSLFGVFSRTLAGLKVLVISPFSDSIETNYSQRHHFFRHNYQYPDFSLVTVNSPITYSGLPRSLYPGNSWLDTLESLKAEVHAKDFDLALLSCGSYAMPLCQYITGSLHKSSIYVGGFLQIFFGIMGRRYEGRRGLLDQINPSAFIEPVEKEKYLQYVDIGSNTATEAFGAYF